MPRTPTPPRAHSPPEDSVPPETKEVDYSWTDDIALGELGEDPHPSPYERITVVPRVPEDEYVASMMRRDSAADSAPPSNERQRDPRTGVTQTFGTPHYAAAGTAPRDLGDYPEIEVAYPEALPSLDLASPVPARGPTSEGPLTLDLFDPVLPAPTPMDMAPREPSAPPRQSTEPPRPASIPGAQVNRRPSLTFGTATGDALELVTVRASSAPPAPSNEITVVEIRDRFEVGDFSGALVAAEALLELDPENAEALLFAEHCRDVLKQMYLSRLGGLRRVPHISMGREQQRWLSLDHRAGFVLSLVDGTSSIDEILDISGMPELDALRILFELLQQNVIKVG
jgi:hypothetical protein